MKYYIISGEASGDLHAANLLREIKILDAQARVRAWGGDKLEAEGAELVKHYRDLAFMGFVEVLANLKTILGNLKFCETDILEFAPDVLILVDYPGFNLRMATFAKKHNIKVYYYISPQIWAWKKNRIHRIKRDVDQMYVILPFEKPFYAELGMDVHFFGHPLLDVFDRLAADSEQEFRKRHQLNNAPLIALLPGSRKQEIRQMLPIMLAAAKRMENAQCVLAAVPWLDDAFYKECLPGVEIQTVRGDTYALLQAAHVALVTSGTATLEAGLTGTPLVVCYKGGQISYWIAKRLVKIKYISLVNLILDRPVVKELIQNALHADALYDEMIRLWEGDGRSRMQSELNALRGVLGGPGASQRVAAHMVNLLRKHT